MRSRWAWSMSPCMAETVKSRDVSLSVSQSTFLRVVAEDDGLRDSDGLVQVGQGVELPLLLLDGNVELLDTLERELVLLDQDADRIAHELGRDLKHVLGHRGRQKDDLGGLREQLEDVIDLLGKAALEVAVSHAASAACGWSQEGEEGGGGREGEEGEEGEEGDEGLTESISSASSRTNIFMASVRRKRRWIMS